MSPIKFAENYYSFRATELVFSKLFQPQTPDQSALSAIESKLVEADNAFLARRYQDAIAAYEKVADLIYPLIDPRYSTGSGFGLKFSRQVDVHFDTLLSAALEWMNVLPVRQPVVAARSRVPFEDGNPEGDVVAQTGLLSSRLASNNGEPTKAAADMQLAGVFTELGNAQAARFFSDRAKQTDEGVAGTISEGQTPPIPASVPVQSSHVLGAYTALEHSGVIRTPVMIPSQPLPASLTQDRSLGMIVDGNLVSFTWDSTSEAPPLADIKSAIYERRVDLTTLSETKFWAGSDQIAAWTLELPHKYYYVIPLGIAECYHALGDYSTAETFYFQSASYQYLNTTIEAPYLWQRLASLYLDWGNSLFLNDAVADALSIYERVLTLAGSVPNSALYTTPALKPGADVARTVIANLGNLSSLSTLDVNPLIAASIVDVHQQVLKIQGGLDFWGIWHNSVPIWTFDYLQSQAINFTQLAISAERDLISFLERADQATQMRQQLEQNAAQAEAASETASLQQTAAEAEAKAYADALTLANERAQNALDNANAYAHESNLAIGYQAMSTMISGGDDGDFGALNRLADEILAGHRVKGDHVKLAAGLQLAGARSSREYEVDALNRQAREMATAGAQAQAEESAANLRASAAAAATHAARLRQEHTKQSLNAFDSQTFTPDVWYRMGEVMREIYHRYLQMAVRTARLMQQAYNFETDQALKLIKADYSSGQVAGLLGAAMLMADIQTFTYDLITSDVSKPQPIRQTISLAERYAFAFENQLRKTGVMEFETRLDDFDLYYPGTYAGRIEAVEVEVDGIVPPSGISGTLTNSGISAYRTPSSLQLLGENDRKYRIQSKETLVLSDYAARQDGLLISTDHRMMRTFGGAGLASTWRLDLPKEINDIDYGALIDVRLTFYYKARFDPTLRDRVKVELNSVPGVNDRQHAIPLRWIYPDAFFNFQNTGELSITLRASDFRSNQRNPLLTNIGILVVTDGSISSSGLNVALSTPTHATVTGQTDASGAIVSTTPSGPWASLASGTALGSYTVSLTDTNNPTLVKNGKLTLTPIINVALILGYSFTPKL